MKILIEARAEGYATYQLGSTLSVGELIDLLQDCDPDAPVYISHDDGYSYGTLSSTDIKEEY